MWSSGDSYESYVGRWSRLVARDFLDRLPVPPGRRWLDVGCGTGALTGAVIEHSAPSAVLGVDPSVGFLRRAATTTGAAFVAGTAGALPVATASFDAAVSGLALNFVPDRRSAVGELRRVVRPGGTVAAYVWDYAGGMQLISLFWDAAVERDPAAAGFHEGLRFDFCRPDPLRTLFEEGRLRDVSVEPIDVPTVFSDFDDYWAPFLRGEGPAPSYVVSLPLDERTALGAALRDTLPTRADGSIHLTARAWAVRGTNP